MEKVFVLRICKNPALNFSNGRCKAIPTAFVRVLFEVLGQRCNFCRRLPFPVIEEAILLVKN